MKTIKIIDLLNKIANGEEVPNKIKYNGTIYEKFDYNNKYYDVENDTRETDILSEHLASESFYNDEVEILEEEKKIPENNFNYIYSCEDEHIMANFENIKTTLKDIIDYLKRKGE